MRASLRAVCFVLFLPGLLPSVAVAQTQPAASGLALAVVALDPGPEATLNAHDSVDVVVEYSASSTAKIFVRPYLRGEPARALTHASPDYAPGQGEAYGWFQIGGRAEVDEIRVTMMEPKSGKTLAQISHPVALIFTGVQVAARARAEWAEELSAQQQETLSAQFQAAAAERDAQTTPLERLLFGQIFMLAVLALFALGLALPIWALLQWRGKWRLAACAPLAVLGVVVLNIVVGVIADPTSHNLWPFEIIMWGGLCVLAIGVLAIARAIHRRCSPEPT